MAFEGYLIYFQESSGSQKYSFPNKYIDFGSYSSTPDQREEIKAYRDENTRNLTRITATGKKSKITFSTRDSLHLAEKQEIQTFFTSHETDSTQRKIHLHFWNDETNSYDEGDFYRPNMEFKIKYITSNDIIYEPFDFELIEY